MNKVCGGYASYLRYTSGISKEDNRGLKLKQTMIVRGRYLDQINPTIQLCRYLQ